MKDTLRTLNNLIKDAKRESDTEATHFKGEYWILHICRNGNPAPLYHDKDITETKNYLVNQVLES